MNKTSLVMVFALLVGASSMVGGVAMLTIPGALVLAGFLVLLAAWDWAGR